MISLEFLLTSLVVVLVPGAGVIYTVSTGLLRGRRASSFASLGCALGILPHLAATTLGLAAVLHTSALAFQALKFAGALYLPQFISPTQGQPLLQMLLLGAVFMAMTFVVFVVYGQAAHGFRRHVIGSATLQRGLRVGFSAAFAALGTRLALSER